MCWNAAVSLNTFVFSSFVLLMILYNNTYTKYKIKDFRSVWVYLFFASFIFIQLIEFFIWRNINNKYYNNVFTTIAAIVIFAQPAFSIMMLSDTQLRNIMLSIYSVFVIPYCIYNFTTTLSTSVSKNGHLQWSFVEKFRIPALIWLFFFLFPMFYEKQMVLFIFGVFFLGLSFYNYAREAAVGSLWCFLVNSIFIYYAALLLFILPMTENKGIC